MRLIRLFIFFILALCTCSCVSKKHLTYFTTIDSTSSVGINEKFQPVNEPIVKINDALVITVSALDPEAVIPYNLPNVVYVSPNSKNVPTTQVYQYYTVNQNGDIDFPVLGMIHVEGLSQSQLINMIEDKLKGQLMNPIVTVRFLSAKVTVLGEVARPGQFNIEQGRMTILEGLGLAGDMTQYGNRTNVLITRENNGKIEFARLDLTKDDVFTSPYYYLQQNDVIYVSPNQARATTNQTIGLWLSMVSTLASAATVVVSVLSATKSL